MYPRVRTSRSLVKCTQILDFNAFVQKVTFFCLFLFLCLFSPSPHFSLPHASLTVIKAKHVTHQIQFLLLLLLFELYCKYFKNPTFRSSCSADNVICNAESSNKERIIGVFPLCGLIPAYSE